MERFHPIRESPAAGGTGRGKFKSPWANAPAPRRNRAGRTESRDAEMRSGTRTKKFIFCKPKAEGQPRHEHRTTVVSRETTVELGNGFKSDGEGGKWFRQDQGWSKLQNRSDLSQIPNRRQHRLGEQHRSFATGISSHLETEQPELQAISDKSTRHIRTVDSGRVSFCSHRKLHSRRCERSLRKSHWLCSHPNTATRAARSRSRKASGMGRLIS